MDSRIVNAILEEMTRQVVDYKSDAYIQIYCMNERLNEFLKKETTETYELVGFRRGGVDYSDWVVSNPRNPEYKSFMVYHAWKSCGKLFETIRTATLEEVLGIIDMYFDTTTLKLKEQYR